MRVTILEWISLTGFYQQRPQWLTGLGASLVNLSYPMEVSPACEDR